MKGLLYLEEVEPKNFTSCIKDARFMVTIYIYFLSKYDIII